jgi:hypothetical protein
MWLVFLSLTVDAKYPSANRGVPQILFSIWGNSWFSCLTETPLQEKLQKVVKENPGEKLTIWITKR